MNLIATIAGNEAVTVRGLVNKHHSLRLKQGLIEAGVAADNHQLHKIRDELILWDDEGNVLFRYAVNGVWFETVKLRTPYSPTSGVIIASLRDTKKINYTPVSTIKTIETDDGAIFFEDLENNALHFYRADHPDVLPFMSISPLWLAVPEFQNLLTMFSEGDFSDLYNISQVKEPKCDIVALVPEMTHKKYPENTLPALFQSPSEADEGQIA
jgi:hypothetical protein